MSRIKLYFNKLSLIGLVTACLLPQSSNAAITLVQSTKARYSGASVQTFSATLNGVTPGNFLVVITISWMHSTNNINTIRDGGGGWYTLTPHSQNSTGLPAYGITSMAYMADAPGGNTTVNVTFTTTDQGDIWFAEFSGVDKFSPLEIDAAHSSATSSTTINDPSVTTVNNGDLIIGVALGAGTITSANAPWTGTADIQDGNDWEYQIQGTAGAVSVNWTQSSANQWNALIAAFKPAGLPSSGVYGIQAVGMSPPALSTSVSATLTNVTAGNLLVAVVMAQSSITISSISDGTAYTKTPNSPSTNASSDGRIWVYYLKSPAAGNHTLTVNLSGSTLPNLWFAELKGADPNNPLETDVAHSATTSSTTVNDPTCTTTTDKDFVVAAAWVSNVITSSTWSGFSNLGDDGVAWQTKTPAGAAQTNFTSNPASQWAAMCAAFKPASTKMIRHKIISY